MIFSNIKHALISLWKRPTSQLPALDGVRSIAILLVFLTHTCQEYVWATGNHSSLFDLKIIKSGWVGVDLFFILSGFFIGSQLWKEVFSKGSIDYLSFFLRRSFRIWPLYFALLAIFWIFLGSVGNASPLADLFFISNYLPEGGIKGSWSISTEEQFYLFIPLLFILITALQGRPRTILFTLVILVLLAPLSRFISWKYLTMHQPASMHLYIKGIYAPFHTHYDGLLVGIILGYLTLKKESSRGTIMLCLVLLTVTAAILRILHKEYFNYSFLAMMFGSFVWMALHFQNFITKILSIRLFYLISRLSFGIYLVHRRVLDHTIPALADIIKPLPVELQFALQCLSALAVSMLITAITYCIIEHPTLKIRTKVLYRLKKSKKSVASSDSQPNQPFEQLNTCH